MILMNYRKTVVAVIYQGPEFFLVQKEYWKGRWDFVQGGVEAGETLEEAVLREATEETNLNKNNFGIPVNTDIACQRMFFPETQEHYAGQRNGFDGKEQYYFLLQFLGDREKIRLGDNLSAQKWCPAEEMQQSVRAQLNGVIEKVVEYMKKQY